MDYSRRKKDKSTIKFTKTIKERFVKVLIGEYGSADKAFTVGVFRLMENILIFMVMMIFLHETK